MGDDSYVDDENNGVIGTDRFLLTTAAFRGSGVDVGYNWAGWLFQWAFAATTATSKGRFNLCVLCLVCACVYHSCV